MEFHNTIENCSKEVLIKIFDILGIEKRNLVIPENRTDMIYLLRTLPCDGISPRRGDYVTIEQLKNILSLIELPKSGIKKILMTRFNDWRGYMPSIETQTLRNKVIVVKEKTSVDDDKKIPNSNTHIHTTDLFPTNIPLTYTERDVVITTNQNIPLINDQTAPKLTPADQLGYYPPLSYQPEQQITYYLPHHPPQQLTFYPPSPVWWLPPLPRSTQYQPMTVPQPLVTTTEPQQLAYSQTLNENMPNPPTEIISNPYIDRIAPDTIRGEYLRFSEHESIKQQFYAEPDEKIEVIYKCEGIFEKPLNIFQGALVGITNKRVFKIDDGVTYFTMLSDIVSYKHKKMNVFKWDQLILTTRDNKSVSYDIYYSDTVKYFVEYLHSKLSHL